MSGQPLIDVDVQNFRDNPPEFIKISMEEYQDMRSDSAMLSALDAAGVDNWEGYALAQEIHAAFNDGDN